MNSSPTLPPPPPPRPLFKMMGLVLPLLALFLIYACCYILPAGNAAVVIRMGAYHRTLEPGLSLKWPWPIEQVYAYDHTLRLYAMPLSEMSTADGHVLLSRAYAAWRIAPPGKGRVIDVSENANALLFTSLQNALRATLSSVQFNTLFQSQSMVKIQSDFARMVQSDIGLQGIEIVQCGIDRLELPGRVTKAVFDRQKAEYEQLAAQTRSLAEKTAIEIEQKATVARAEILADAEKKAGEIRSRAEREILQQQHVFKKNPELAEFLQKLNAVEMILREKTTLVITPQTAPFNLLTDSDFFKAQK